MIAIDLIEKEFQVSASRPMACLTWRKTLNEIVSEDKKIHRMNCG
jgi:hypothetical protein